MPIFKRKPKTFKEKREALGVERRAGDDRVILPSGKVEIVHGIHGKGPMFSRPLNEINPQKRALREKTDRQISQLNYKLELLKKTKPKDRADSLKIKNKIQELNSKKTSLTSTLNFNLKAIENKRINARASKQATSLFRNLYGLAYPETANNRFNRSILLAIDSNLIRESYQKYVRKKFDVKNFSFNMLSKKDARIILNNAREKM